MSLVMQFDFIGSLMLTAWQQTFSQCKDLGVDIDLGHNVLDRSEFRDVVAVIKAQAAAGDCRRVNSKPPRVNVGPVPG